MDKPIGEENEKKMSSENTNESVAEGGVAQFTPREKWRIMKNIVVVSLAFMVHFTAFQGAGNLQSSVNAAEGLGTASLATIYFALILSNVFLPVVMISVLNWGKYASFQLCVEHLWYEICPGNENNANSNMERPPDSQIYTVAGIYLACMVSACLIVAFGVYSIKRYNEGKREGTGTGLTSFSLPTIMLKLLKERKQLLNWPITMYLGVEQAFIGADYTVEVVNCLTILQNMRAIMQPLV